MKTYNLFLLTILFIGIFNKSAFGQEQNCEEAKKKYLIENPDVAKAGIDAWGHYLSYGKKEGRKWPDCNTKIETNCEQAKKKYLFENPDVAKAGMDAWSHYTYYGKKEGRKWPDCSDTNQNQKNDKNLGIITKPIFADTGKLAETIKYVQSLGEKSDQVGNFYNLQYVHQEFDFYDKPLVVLDAKVDESLGSEYIKSEKVKLENLLKGYLELKKQDSLLILKFNNYRNKNNNEFENYYQQIKQSIQIIEFGINWTEYSKKLSKALKNDVKQYYNGNFFKSSIKQGESNFSYHQLKYMYSGKIDYSFDNIKLYKIIEKAILKHPEIIVSDDKRQSIIERETGLDEEYFKIKVELASTKEKLQLIEKYLFVKLPKRDNSLGEFLFIGNTSKNIPNGYGYLINEKKQLIAIGYWDEGFPVLLYNVNIYHVPEGNIKDFRYYPSDFSQKYSSKTMYTYIHGYQGHNIKTYGLYIGDYYYNSKENKIYQDGYGTYFYSAWDKTDKQLYVGNYIKGNRDGKGTHHDKSFTYEGAWKNGSLNFGTITSKTDKSVYTGEIKDWRMNGEGKIVYSNGNVKEGIFENGIYLMTKQQYLAEQNRKEQERIAEERRLEEARVAEEKRKEEVRKANMYKFSKPKLNIQWVDNRVACCCCQERYCQFEESRANNKETAEYMYLVETLYLHHKKIGADKETASSDVANLTTFIMQNFPNGYLIAPGIVMAYAGMPMLEAFGEVTGSPNREVEIYYIKDKRCKICKSQYYCESDRDCK
jgi:hypothetical protein